jgi:iron complex outermembrane receptor protein
LQGVGFQLGLEGRSFGLAPSTVGALGIALLVAAAPGIAHGQEIEALRGMSIEDLQNINVSSVSKTDMPLSDAAAAIYVISRDDILRSGAATIPEMLRLAPNLQVYEKSPSEWVVTARGLNGNDAAQSFSNKLLVLIDGRTVYTPLFSGVYWDLPDVLPDDIDRIEVISGPGATLWGANAVNGVINIITRRSSETKGLYADLRAGPDRQVLGARISGQAGKELSYEVHGRFLREEHAASTAAGASAEDGWKHGELGFRADWTPSEADLVTLEGQIFRGRNFQPGSTREDTSGGNMTLRWNRQLRGGGAIQAQAFYDRIERDDRASGGGMFHTDTFDGEVQHNFTAGSHAIVWGGGARLVDYRIDGTPSLFFTPAHRGLFIANAFAQDSIGLSDGLTLIAGLKAERLPYAGTSILPEVRLAWKLAPAALVWGSVERAVRSPTPFDEDVQERFGTIVALSGNPLFSTEKLTAFELGTRVQPASALSLSVTAFYHLYDDLRTVELGTGPATVLNLTWDNNLKGHTYGVEAWADWRVTPWWSLSGGATLLARHFTFKPASGGLLGPDQNGNDPPYTVKLRSSFNPIRDITLDAEFRAYGPLHAATVKAYQELDARVAWQVTPAIALSANGTNLLHDRHREYEGGDFIPRRIMGGLELRY